MSDNSAGDGKARVEFDPPTPYGRDAILGNIGVQLSRIADVLETFVQLYAADRPAEDTWSGYRVECDYWPDDGDKCPNCETIKTRDNALRMGDLYGWSYDNTSGGWKCPEHS